MSMYSQEIANATDWQWYCASIDVRNKVHYKHGDAPTEYPVRVHTETWEDDYRDHVSHKFIYKQRVECDSCHTVKVVWPEGSI